MRGAFIYFEYEKSVIVPAATYFPRAQAQVSSALRGLTSEFGMGSGVTLSQEPPEQWRFLFKLFFFFVIHFFYQFQ